MDFGISYKKMFENIDFFQVKFGKIHTKQKRCEIAFYISIPSFRALGLIVKNFEIFGGGSLNMFNYTIFSGIFCYE